MAYITLEDADAWIAGHIRAADRTRWAVLEDADKTIALQEAEDVIDDLPLRGDKYDRTGVQTAEFPRIIDGVICGDESENVVIPQHVKDAVCLEAVALCQASNRRTLQKEGVQNYSIGGKLSETFMPGAGSEALVSERARRIMRRYTGYNTR